MNRDEGVPPPGARGPAYIAPPNECGLSDQTDLNRMVFLEAPKGEGGRPAPRPARPPICSRGFWTLLDDRKLAHALISVCVGVFPTGGHTNE